MPEEQVQADMNDYYAHWWSLYAGLVQEGGVDVTSVQEEPAAEDHAFDKTALPWRSWLRKASTRRHPAMD